MPLVVVKNEKKLSDVIARAFGKLKPADLSRVRAAVMRANPHLAEAADLSPGVMVVIPGIPGLAAVPTEAPDRPGAEAVAEISRGLEEYRKRLAVAVREDQAATSDLVTLLKSKDIRTLIKEFPEATGYVEGAAAEAKARGAELEERLAFLKRLARAQEDLEELAQRLSR